MKQVVIVAALEREVQSLIAEHCADRVALPGTGLHYSSGKDISVVCGGIGAAAVREATLAVIQACKPDLLVSVGFAGALAPGLSAGELIVPATVISSESGRSYTAINATGKGTLITANRIADAVYKAELAAKYHAAAVDMEAATVAELAEQNGIGFMAVKAISDEAHVTLPDVSPFINPKGDLRLAAFLWHLAVRPWIWPGIARLARNSGRASRALYERLAGNVTSGEFQRIASANFPIKPL